MRCRTIQHQLSLYAGGELDSVASAVVAEHLRTCEPCRSKSATYGVVRATLGQYGRDMSSGHAAPDLFAGLRDRLDGPPSFARQQPFDRRGDVFA